ncbi:MAG: glycoside hydrolase family 2 TIM barrel-domain containing protein [Tepidisphaeraceae bacterium]
MQFVRELTEMIDTLHNHPSIIAWVPFNEGWGQHDTNEVLKWTKQYDPTRLVDGPSGWDDRGFGDMHDMHNYPGPGMFPVHAERISVLGEFGGLGLPIEGHLWQSEKNWGYRNMKATSELNDRYADLAAKLIPLARRGLAAAVYTQTTDVEGEVNGFATYDRKVVKFDEQRTAESSRKVIAAANDPVKIVELVPTSRQQPQTYSYTFEKPAAGWEKAAFDASSWKSGPGGFGTPQTPGAVVKTEWSGDDIWLRRTIKLDRKPGDSVMLNIHHDDDVEVFINGVLAYKLNDALGAYAMLPVSPEAAAALKAGDNVIAIHCHQRGGGQYVDVGLVELMPVK